MNNLPRQMGRTLDIGDTGIRSRTFHPDTENVKPRVRMTIRNDPGSLIGAGKAERSAGERDDTVISISRRVVSPGVADYPQGIDTA